jgi:hypothetical protein
MAKKLAILTTSIAFVSVFAVNASAVTIDDNGVVGAFTSGSVEGPGNPPEAEDAAAEFLLDMLSNTEFPNPCSLSNTTGVCFHTSDNGDGTGYSGNLGTPVKVDNNSTDVAGWTWVLGKYDGPNAGYILFYIPDWGNTIPSNPSTIWGTGEFGLSHTLRWGTVSVPDGGATLMLLGAALSGLGLMRRRSKK